MSSISESNLPGVCRKFQVETLSGDRLTIVIHDDGTRELYQFGRKNFDRPVSVLRLTDGEERQRSGGKVWSSSGARFPTVLRRRGKQLVTCNSELKPVRRLFQ